LAVLAVVVIVACVVASERLDVVPEGVLAAFGVAGVVPVRLPGGQGSTWRAGRVVLKPADSARAGQWFAEVCDALAGPGFRVPRPVAWGERDPGPLLGPAAGQIAGQVRLLLAALRPVDLPSQLIHADLTGNVLFADGMPPAVIDFSPLERPAGWPLAIAAVDALQWEQARPEVLGLLAGEPELDQLLARALIYRQITEIVRHAGTAGIDVAARTGQPLTDLILARLAQPR
jgi:hypothetical protein